MHLVNHSEERERGGEGGREGGWEGGREGVKWRSGASWLVLEENTQEKCRVWGDISFRAAFG